MPRIPAPGSQDAEIAALRIDLEKVLSFAASAGQMITNRDALEVIKSICVARLHGDIRAAALARHAETVRELEAAPRG